MNNAANAIQAPPLDSVPLHPIVGLRRAHKVGRHLLAFADGGADWCRRCGTFDCYLLVVPCEPKPMADRFWPQRKANKEISEPDTLHK